VYLSCARREIIKIYTVHFVKRLSVRLQRNLNLSTILAEIFNTEFFQNQPNGNQVLPCWWTYGHTVR